jgi:uncharacterized protein YraI
MESAMNKRLTLAAAVFAAGITLPAVASAAVGYTTGSVNLRTGPSTSYARITTVPAGSPVEVHDCASWCRVSWNGYTGWMSGNYVDVGYRGRYERPRYYTPRYSYRDRYRDRYWDGPRYRYRDRYSDYRPGGGIYFGFGF